MAEFGLDKPLWQQFFIYVGNIFQGNLGTSFANYPASVGSLISQALPWSIAIQLPAIIIGWIVGNLLGAVAAFKGGWLDRGAFIGSLFLSSVPPFALAIILLFLVAVKGGILPVGGAYSFRADAEFSLAFFGMPSHISGYRSGRWFWCLLAARRWAYDPWPSTSSDRIM
jgi:peptide/nickel transport system permease protein